MLDVRKVAIKLKQLRVDKGLTQDDVANSIYVSRQAVSSWEMGSSLPSITSCIMLLDLYETTLEELLCLSETSENGELVRRILADDGDIEIGEVMYKLAPSERWKIVRAVRNGTVSYEVEEIIPYCNKTERDYLLRKGEKTDEF
ncbi:MAG: helix-turn-helix domain-containing protein [Erysipelotrichaceae bacterium]|nr:helix-turn-helix domain-containing protein [Erysipelotrichaceae bacterium]